MPSRSRPTRAPHLPLLVVLSPPLLALLAPPPTHAPQPPLPPYPRPSPPCPTSSPSPCLTSSPPPLPDPLTPPTRPPHPPPPYRLPSPPPLPSGPQGPIGDSARFLSRRQLAPRTHFSPGARRSHTNFPHTSLPIFSLYLTRLFFSSTGARRTPHQHVDGEHLRSCYSCGAGVAISNNQVERRVVNMGQQHGGPHGYLRRSRGIPSPPELGVLSC